MSEPKDATLSNTTRIPLGWLLGALATVSGGVATIGWGRIQSLEATSAGHEIRLTKLEGRAEVAKESLDKLDARLERIEAKLDRLVRREGDK